MNKKSKADNIVILFVEGATDELFYKRLIETLRKEKGEKIKHNVQVIIENLKGIGQYKHKLSRIIKNKIKRDHRNCRCCAILCYDTDVFEFSSKPPLILGNIVKELKKDGVDEVKFIKASHSIEDWFLIDSDGVLNFLNLPADKNKVDRTRGLKEIERLFKKANRVYVKGLKCNGFIECLDIRKILSYISQDIKRYMKSY